MYIPEKKVFDIEVAEIKDKKIQILLMQLYDHLLGKISLPNAKPLCLEVLANLFTPKYTTEVLIPLSFHDSTIATVIYSILYGTDEKTYTVNDIIERTKTKNKPKGLSKQYLKQEINAGNLKGQKKNGYWSFDESQVNEYLKTKELK
jgi:hypothetical protein